jgi:hypothetical protein
LLSHLGEDLEEDDILYHKYSYEQGSLRANPADHFQVVATGKAICDILVKNLVKKDSTTRSIWSDSDACYQLVVKYLKQDYIAKFLPRDHSRREWAVAVAKDIVSVSMATCQLGQESLNKVLSGYQACTDRKAGCLASGLRVFEDERYDP